MTIGYCEGLCGGQLSHHLVRGLCPECRHDPRIHDRHPYDGAHLGAEASVQHVLRDIWLPERRGNYLGG